MRTTTLISAEKIIAEDPGGGETQPLTLDIPKGSITCLVGPAGGGKTLFLKTLAGIIPPKKGRLKIFGQDMRSLPKKSWASLRKKVAYVGADTPLISFYSGWQNVIFPARYHQLDQNEEIEHKAETLIEKIGFRGELSVLPAYLNRVEAFKLTLVRALMLDPSILVLDEPFKHLDSLSREEVGKKILGLVNHLQLTMIVATHDLTFAIKHATTLIYVDQGGNYLFLPGNAVKTTTIPEVRHFLSTLENGWQPDHEKSEK
jgi:ABC-type multidrug transport system ATPase subunit